MRTTFHPLSAFLAVLCVLAQAAPPARAQEQAEPQDWVVARLPEQNAVVALAEFDGAPTFVARCVDNVYDLTVSGLPPAKRGEPTRILRMGFDGGDLAPTVWTVANDADAAFSRVPVMLARRLAMGGEFQIAVPGVGDRPGIRYVLTLPRSSTAIAETLAACGRPLVDPRPQLTLGNGQDGLPSTIEWARAPRPVFPRPVNGRSPLLGYVTLSCRPTAEGVLEACEIESEHPRGYNLGRSVMTAMADARVRSKDGSPVVSNCLILFTVNFAMR